MLGLSEYELAKRVDKMDYSATLRVPNTRNSELLNSLIKEETKLMRMTGYNIACPKELYPCQVPLE